MSRRQTSSNNDGVICRHLQIFVSQRALYWAESLMLRTYCSCCHHIFRSFTLHSRPILNRMLRQFAEILLICILFPKCYMRDRLSLREWTNNGMKWTLSSNVHRNTCSCKYINHGSYRDAPHLLGAFDAGKLHADTSTSCCRYHRNPNAENYIIVSARLHGMPHSIHKSLIKYTDLSKNFIRVRPDDVRTRKVHWDYRPVLSGNRLTLFVWEEGPRQSFSH